MKRLFIILLGIMFFISLTGCSNGENAAEIAVTTLPVYTFTNQLCHGTELDIVRIVNQDVSCLHDYTLQVRQVQAIEAAKTVVISGAGLEDFIADAVKNKEKIIDASQNIELICSEDSHAHNSDHNHTQDPHIWLSPQNAKIMANEICNGLIIQFPEYKDVFQHNLQELQSDLDTLHAYAQEAFRNLQCRQIITFHDGFAYFAEAYDITIVHAIEEESGSEASAKELKDLIILTEAYDLPAVFIEKNGSTSAANIIAAETDVKIYALDMAISGESYFDAMYHNIDTIKEALG